MTAKPHDGVSVLLHLVEAVRAWDRKQSGLGTMFDQEAGTVRAWLRELEEHLEEVVPKVPPVGWEPRRWEELVAGDTVSLGGQEAVVASAMLQEWHVDPASSEYRPQPLEHSYVALRLEGRDPLYRMPPTGEVETLRGPAGQAVDEANGRHLGMVEADRVVVMGSWARDAMLTLEAAGLDPEPIAMTPPERES